MVAPQDFIRVETWDKPVDGEYVEYCKVLPETDPYLGDIYEVGYKDQDVSKVRKCRKCGALNEFVEY